jgi:hypothetical protein
MPSRILASFVPFLLIAASLAQAAKSDGDDCCPTSCPVKYQPQCTSNCCVPQPKCPCPPSNSCVTQDCQCNPNGCCANGNCKLPPAAPPLKDEAPAARRQVAPRVAMAKAPARKRVTTTAPVKAIAKPVETPVETPIESSVKKPAEQSSQSPAGEDVAVAQAPKEQPAVEKTDEKPAEKPAPGSLEPITAEQLSMPPLGKPLPPVKAGVVESPAPRALFVMPAAATNPIQKQSHNASQGKAPAAEKPQAVANRAGLRNPNAVNESGVPNVRPMSEISPSRDPLPPPMAPEYNSIRRK